MPPNPPTQRLPILVVAVAASAWGLFWMPLRAFEEGGLSAGWVTISQFAAPVVVLLPLALWRSARGQSTGFSQVATGLIVGGAVALYAESVLLTEVARALILFYATPVWSTLLEVVFMGHQLKRARILSLALGLAGLFTILGGKTGIPLPQNLGDAMALLSGVLWAFGSMRVRQTAGVSTFETVFSFFLYGAVVALAIAFLPIDAVGGPPDWTTLKSLLHWLLLVAVGFLIPVMWGLLWGSAHIDPGRLGILLQLEAVVGIGSAALLTNEPFGLVEVLGTALIIAAGIVDVFGNRGSTAKSS
jgi:drug/metabolite transporter (DMT)-like permease